MISFTFPAFAKTRLGLHPERRGGLRISLRGGRFGKVRVCSVTEVASWPESGRKAARVAITHDQDFLYRPFHNSLPKTIVHVQFLSVWNYESGVS